MGTITVIGKLADTAAYLNKPGYSVYPRSDDWTPERGRAWIIEAVQRGDQFLLVSTDFTGVYQREIVWLRVEAQKLRRQALTLKARALKIDEAVSDAAKREWTKEPLSGLVDIPGMPKA